MSWMKLLRRVLKYTILFALLVGLLFCANGLWPSWDEGEMGTTGVPAGAAGKEIRILAFNIAKVFFHEGGIRFAEEETVRERLDQIAEVIRRERADIVALSEVVKEAAPCPVDQVEYLARAAKMHAWAFGENYSFGIPWIRIRAGNAVLSRFPLRDVECRQLTGEKPFWSPTNNRRLLLCEVRLGDRWMRVGSVRNDSFDLANNARQADEILEFLGDEPILLAGDFNAQPHDEAMKAFKASGRFAGAMAGPPTFPSRAPEERIDYVLAPRSWTLVEDRVLPRAVSDHLAVLAVFRIP